MFRTEQREQMHLNNNFCMRESLAEQTVLCDVCLWTELLSCVEKISWCSSIWMCGCVLDGQ